MTFMGGRACIFLADDSMTTTPLRKHNNYLPGHVSVGHHALISGHIKLPSLSGTLFETGNLCDKLREKKQLDQVSASGSRG